MSDGAYEPTDEEMRELADWIATRPAAVRKLMDRFPPMSYVVAREGQNLVVPAPGVVGQVVSYQHDEETDRATVNVEAEDGVLPLPFAWKGECDPDWLEVVDDDRQRRVRDLYERAKAMASTPEPPDVGRTYAP